MQKAALTALNKYHNTVERQAAEKDSCPARESVLLPKGQEQEAQWLSAFAGGAHRYFICRRTDCGAPNQHF
eukprot:3853398-Prorocentrum_lima.AAC.1